MQRRILPVSLVIGSVLGLGLTAVAAPAFASVQETYYVSPTGNDSNNGLSTSAPFKTLNHARAVVATQIGSQTGDINVDFAGGDYPFSAPVTFGTSDSPKPGYTIRYQAESGQTPVFDGGASVTGWTQVSGSIYSASLSGISSLRDLWVNGKRATIARSSALTEYTGTGTSNGDVGSYTFSGTPSWALSAESTTRVPPVGIGFTTGTLPSTFSTHTNTSDLELVESVGFSQHVVGLTGVTAASGFNEAVLQQPMGAIAWSEPTGWGSSFDDRSAAANPRAWYLQNAYDFLTPGSFYFNSATNTVYYDERAGESMSTAVVDAPVTSALVTVAGTSTSSRANHIEFDGITFGYTNWALDNIAGSYGESTVQGNALYTKYYADTAGQNNWHETNYTETSVMPAAVQVSSASSISFTNDTFTHIGSGALNFGNDTINSTVKGGVFSDISGSAVTIGDPRNTYIGDGDFATGVEGLPTGDTVSDNVITSTGVEFAQTVPIMGYYANGLTITHNVVSGAPYTGISLGWGFNYYGGYQTGVTASTIAGNNTISDNIVANVMQTLHDGGGIYVLGSQTGSEMTGNVVDTLGVGSPIYTDQASSGWEIARNVLADFGTNAWWDVWGSDAHVSNIYAHDNFADYVTGSEGSAATSSSSINNVSTWSALADATVAAAGVESAYTANLPSGLSLGSIRSRIEAETGTLGGRAIVSSDSSASGGALVAQLDTVGTSVSYSPVAAATSVTVHYASVNTGHISVYVNGTYSTSLSFTSTGSWLTSFSDATAILAIPEGATVSFQNHTGDSGLNIDYLTFHRQQSGFLEAEAQTFGGTANAVTGISGANNGAVVQQLDAVGNSVSFANVASASGITVRYASNTSGHESVYVNGTKVGTLSFTSTGGWYSGWSTASLATSIPAGATVKIQCDSGDSGFNLDSLTLS